jgi:hypothetical protein
MLNYDVYSLKVAQNRYENVQHINTYVGNFVRNIWLFSGGM